MTDRIVSQIGAAHRDGDPEPQPHRFSSFREAANIVLLGDPGAGKSHLFREAAAAEGARYMTARTFLNVPSPPPGSALFVDALDERRAGRGDLGIVDAIVQKLFTASPAKVRISCRAVDWLGESDLAAFQPYFEHSGDAVVLYLDHLSADERREVLGAQGMSEVEADQFVEEAENRDLAEFLENPRNLIMLVEAVRAGDWPATRRELFELSTGLLLSEINQERARAGSGTYAADELRDAAGAICAARLISDVAGISLLDREDVTDIPSYRSLAFLDLAKVQAALGRRAFEMGPVPESVDYVHRTTAEFLGATWLAGRVRAGLPLSRVQALMGVDGHPAPELRGLHAWLAITLPEEADRLIEADPYGALTYGDAGSLATSSRRFLLEALGRLSETDPWFRAGSWQSPGVGALAQPDMIEAFQDVLHSPSANFGLRSVVIDALRGGPPLPALKDDLANIVTRAESPYAERLHAMQALCRFGPEGKAAVVRVYRERLGRDDPCLRLRAAIVNELYGEPFGPADVTQIMGDILASEAEVTGGTLWPLPRFVPLADIPDVLNRFEPIERALRSKMERRNVWEVAAGFERLLLRALEQREVELEPAAVWRWLRVWQAFRDRYNEQAAAIRDALRQRPELLKAIAEDFIQTGAVGDHRWSGYIKFRNATAGAIDSDRLLEWVVAYLPATEPGADREKFLYELALHLTFGASLTAQAAFEELYSLADARPELSATRDSALICGIATAVDEDDGPEVEATDPNEVFETRRRNFETNAELIRSGNHAGWLEWIAFVYFRMFNDVDKKATPRERLVTLLGDDHAQIALEGLRASLQRSDVPTLEQVVELAVQHQVKRWWYALVAGLDERWQQEPTLEGLSDALLRAALAIVQAHPTFVEIEGTNERRSHGWKDAVFQFRPELARDAYLALARAGLTNGEQHVDGLRELLDEEAFAPFRADAVVSLLRESPNANPSPLAELLRSGVRLPAAHSRILDCAQAIMAGHVAVEQQQRDLWVTAAYFIAPPEFEAAVEREAAQRPQLVFLLCDLAGYERRGSQQPVTLPLGQLEFLARITGTAYPEAPHPSGGWSGNTNPWDAAEFVRHLVNTISAVASDEATAALVRLDANASLASYQVHIRHALANQRQRRREAEYDRPDWPRTVAAFSSGPPASVSDLHALLVAHFVDLKARIVGANTDIYKACWNEDKYGRPTRPKPEESCRDVLVGLLRQGLTTLGITVEPEGHMVSDRRADISTAMPGRKILCELKRDYHADVWSAAENQLDRFYTIDPEAKGYGIYGVFWFGARRPSAIRLPPGDQERPQSVAEMESMLRELIPSDKRDRIAVVVFDVSGEH